MHLKRLSFYFSLFLVFQSVFALDLCSQYGNCRDCIRDVNQCVWCDTHKLSDAKCKSVTENLENWCPSKIINPRSTYNFEKNNDFSTETGKVVQIKPQQVKTNIRPGDSINFNFSLKPAQHYPLDLYFLLDASNTMENDINTMRETNTKDIITQIEEIYESIKKITDNVYLGLGYFVDKNLLPFTNILNSTNTYSFRNELKLVDDPEAFQNTIRNMTFGYSYIEPKSGLEALAQVLVCEELIGWRKESRKIVVLLTNSPIHVAGDGKSAGLTQPYDGKCYTKNKVYEKELEMDYPSVGYINQLASKNEVIIIFALQELVKDYYDIIINHIRGSEIVEYPKDEIFQKIKSVYENFSKKLKLKVDIKPEYQKYLDFSFNPNCYTSYTSDRSDVSCEVKPNSEKEFNVTITLMSLINDSIKMDINIVGIKEKLEIDVAVIEQCDCNRENNSKSCNHHGSLECGTCECDIDRYYGDSCQCETINRASHSEDTSSCIANGTKTICNNRGSCNCGMCNCRKGYKGPFCQCSDISCKRGVNNELCSGPNNGVCDCGQCKCNSDWNGEICDCSKSMKKCTSGDGKSLCNNRGKCICGQCTCDSVSDWDVRTKEQPDCTLSCSEELSCHRRQCLNIAPIVVCYLNSNETQCKHSKTINITVVSNFTLVQSQSKWNHCPKVIEEVGCYTQFLYRYRSDSYGIEVIMEKAIDCVEANFLWGGICLATLIVIGVGTLITWKIWTDRIDRLEYDHLIKQISGNANDRTQNRIFVEPNLTYHNPQYNDAQVNKHKH